MNDVLNREHVPKARTINIEDPAQLAGVCFARAQELQQILPTLFPKEGEEANTVEVLMALLGHVLKNQELLLVSVAALHRRNVSRIMPVTSFPKLKG